jgi:hypothetical protein
MRTILRRSPWAWVKGSKSTTPLRVARAHFINVFCFAYGQFLSSHRLSPRLDRTEAITTLHFLADAYDLNVIAIVTTQIY